MKTSTLLYLIKDKNYQFLFGKPVGHDHIHDDMVPAKQTLEFDYHTIEYILFLIIFGMCQYKKHTYLILESLLLTFL